MNISEINSNRSEVALELFEEGHSFEFSGISFYLDKENQTLRIDALTNWELGNLTQQIAISEILRGKEVLNYLIEQSSQFRKLIHNYQPRFSLIVNMGNAFHEICYLENEKIVWN